MTEASFFDQINGHFTQQELILHWERLAGRYVLSRELLESVRIELVEDTLYGNLIAQLQAYVLGERLPDHTVTETGSVSVEYPATWWQHVKHQYRGRWWMRALARRHPPRMKTETATGSLTATWHHMALYPWAKHVCRRPDSLGLGDVVRMSYLESTRSGEMFR